MTTGYRNLATVCLSAVLAFGLAACGGSSATKTDAELEMERVAALEMECEATGGRFESDESCTSAAELVAEAAQMACTDAGGRYEADGSCTSADDVEAERLAAAEMACTGASGRWESDNTCTSAADVLAEVAQANCEAGGGRYESDGSCTSAADVAAEMEMERLAGLEMACEDAGGRWNADNTCTDSAGLEMERLAGLEMACEDAGGRWNADNTCTDSAGLEMERLAGLEMACEDAGGRWNADNTCTDSAGLEMERLAGLEMACTDAGGRWNADNTCTDSAGLVAEAAEMNCAAGGGRYESDGSCTSAAELETERLAGLEMACTGAGGRWNDDDTCTTSAELVAEQVAAAAMAKKLYDGISAPTATDTGAEDNRFARHASGDNDNAGNIQVSIDGADDVYLSEDKKTMVAARHGWEGKRYVAEPDNGGMYEAVVYSDVGDPTQGDKFSTEYTLADGALALITGGSAQTDFAAGRVASSHFDQSAGVKSFKLPDPNSDGATRINIPGDYHGVSGTYTCTPGTGNACAARIAAEGFDLGTVNVPADGSNPTFTNDGGTWTFKPGNPDARVMSVPDAIYASYGWWIHMSEDGYTASAFVANMGAVPEASAIDTLRGTATYEGGAAGKYALYSSTGGTNDAGHFTADAMLEANFDDDTISGTINSFMGADGQMRNWSVELKKSGIAATGGIVGDGITDSTDMQETVWTIDGTPEEAAGQWSGTLYDNGADGVPKVATGTFTSQYSTAGEMVGAFGVNKQ